MVLLLSLIGVGVVIAAPVLMRTRRSSMGIGTEVETAAARHTRVVLVGSLVVALFAASMAAWVSDGLGRGIMLAPVIFGVVLVAGVTTGEMSMPTDRSVARSAVLTQRRVVDYLPVGFTGLVVCVGVMLASLLIIGVLTGSPDDLGRPGRSLAWEVPGGAHSSGPWPGSFYALPCGIGLLLVVLGILVGLRAAVVRPQVNADARSAVMEDAMRRLGVVRILAAGAVSLSGVLLGVSFVMFVATAHRPHGTPEWLAVLNVLAAVAFLLAATAGVAGLRRLAKGGRAVS